MTIIEFYVWVANNPPHPTTKQDLEGRIQASALSAADQLFLTTALGDRDGYVEVLARMKQEARQAGIAPMSWICIWIHQ